MELGAYPLLVCLPLFLSVPAAFAADASSAKTYNIRDFGAKGDGTTKDTVAVQKALDTCAVNGGGVVTVPAGKYLIGSVQLGYRTTLALEKDSILTGTPDLDDYPLIDIRWEGRWQSGHRSLIYAANVDHVGITGPGLLEGNPTTAASNRQPRGTLVVEFISCSDVKWDGFSVRQTGNNWATHPTYCTHLDITHVNIYGGRDGIDVDSCRQVLIDHCTIDSGDDSVSIKSGRGLDGARLGLPTEDVTITNCTMTGRRFACIGIGSEISAGVRNLHIAHCTFTARTHAIYLKTRIGRAGINENITADDCDILGGGFLRINLTRGGNLNTNDDPVEGLVGYPAGRNLRFTHIRLKDATVIAEVTEVAPEKPVENLTLSDITGTAARGISLVHVKGAVLRDLKVTGLTGPLLATDDATGTGLEGAVPYVAPPPPPPRPPRTPPPATP